MKKQNKKITLGWIGIGNLGEALLSGFFSSSAKNYFNLVALSHHKTKDAAWKKKGSLTFVNSYQDLCEAAQILVIAIKPKNIPELLLNLKPYYQSHHVLWTLAAGLTVSFYQKALVASLPVIRIMPNLAGRVHSSATGIYAAKTTTKKHFSDCEKFFSALGKVFKLPREQDLQAFTALAGSGPAFWLHLATLTIDQAKKFGFTQTHAEELILQVILGTAKLWETTGGDPQIYIRNVTSPQGTTAAGLQVLKKNILEKTWKNAFTAAAHRAEEIAKKGNS